MASINSVSSSNTTSSLYNSANVISGLASGLDTESMIEGLVQSYQTKIQQLNNKATKLTWKQDAYRSIISKMNAFSNKYTSYTSATNLMSTSFFNNAIKVATQGKYADKVTASGRTNSDIKLNKVTQLATAARYTTNSNLDLSQGFDITAASGVKFDDTVEMGTLSGSLTLNYGSKTISVTFDANKDMIDNSLSASEKAKALGKMIQSKLADEKVTLSSGETKAASDLVSVNVDSTGRITFKDKTTGGNSVYISGASGTVEGVLGLDLSDVDEKKPNTIEVKDYTRLTQTPSVASLISGKTMNISLDGKSKSIYLPRVIDNGNGTYSISEASAGTDKDGNTVVTYGASRTVNANEYADYYTDLVQKAVSKEFGSKIKVENLGGDIEDYDGNVIGKSLQLSFTAPDNSSMIINTDAGNALGIGNTATNYLNTSKTLGELTKKNAIDWSSMTKATNDDGSYQTDKDGQYLYDLVINGVKVGAYNENSKLSDIMTDINNSKAGVKVSYSQTTKNFTFTTKDTGAEAEINIDGGLAGAIFGSTNFSAEAPKFGDAYGAPWLGNSDITVKTANGEVTVSGGGTIEDVAAQLNNHLKNFGQTAAYNKYTGQLEITDKSGAKVDFTMSVDDEDFGLTDLTFNPAYAPDVSYTPGQDAKFQVEVNGQTLDMTRSSNSTSIDGLTINFKSTFTAEEGDEVTFQTSVDSDKIVDAVKSMINDYNEMIAEIRSQFATMPYQDSSGAFKTYEPLSDEDKATMSESAIQNYEEKAKQGILFNDYNLSSLYDKMRAVFSPGGSDETLLRQMGISVTYSSTDNSPSIVLDESKLREMLDNDPDAVTDVFTRSVEAGGSSNGIMQNMKVQLDRYASTTGATKGILVEQAGTPLSSLTLMNNTWQKQIDNIYTDIEKWQDKLSAQVDKYTSMFSKLEVLINQMNSQSSTLAGLMGG